MDEPLTKADLDSLRNDLRGEIRATEERLSARIGGGNERLDAKIDDVSERLDAKIDDVSERLDAKIDDVSARLDAKIDDVSARLDAKIDDVGVRLDARINEADRRLGARIDGLEATMDSGFAMVGRLLGETRADLMRHTDVRFEALRDDIKKLADGLLACNERLTSHVQDPDAHRRGWGQ
jgi:hypothetical protein